jgi:hypothetical protein
MLAHAPHAAAGAEDLGLVREGEADLVAVEAAEKPLHRLREVVEVDDHVVNAGAEECVDGMGDERPVADRHHRLGHDVRDRTKAGAEAGRKDHRFHGKC